MRLVRCDNKACNRVYSAQSAMIVVTMWKREWHFCSGSCLDEWAGSHAQDYWTNYGAENHMETLQEKVSE